MKTEHVVAFSIY